MFSRTYSHRIERKYIQCIYAREESREVTVWPSNREKVVYEATSSDHALVRKQETEQGIMLFVGLVRRWKAK
jgi:hypothetical protein